MAGRNLDEALKPIEKKVKEINSFMIALVFVAVLGFVTLLVTVCGLVITYQHDSQDTYKEARDATNSQNDKIDTLIKAVQAQKAEQNNPQALK